LRRLPNERIKGRVYDTVSSTQERVAGARRPYREKRNQVHRLKKDHGKTTG